MEKEYLLSEKLYKILKDKGKIKKVDFKKLQDEKFKSLEKIFNEVV